MPGSTKLVGGLNGAIGCTFVPSTNQLVLVEYDTGKLDTFDLATSALKTLGTGYNQPESYREVYAASGGIPDPAKDPTNNVDGCYINYCDSALNAYGLPTALALYYGGNLPRLVKAKQQWDPLNYFQNAQSIPLKL
jgi:Berberine and berberine like